MLQPGLRPPSRVAAVPAPQIPNIAHRFTGDYQVGAYVADDVDVDFWHESGKLAVPIAAVSGNQEVIQWSAPFGGKVVTFEVVRFGLMPLVPGPESSDANVVYLRGRVKLKTQISLNGSDYWYGVAGYYMYAFLAPVFTASGLPFGVHVTDRTDPRDLVLPPDAFVDTMKPLPTVQPAIVGSVTAGLLGGGAGSSVVQPGLAPGDDLNRIRKLVQKPPRP